MDPARGSSHVNRGALDKMPETAPQQQQRWVRHRRSHSDTTFFHLPDTDEDFLFDVDSFGFPDIFTDAAAAGVPMAVDSMSRSEGESSSGVGPGGHSRSVSVEADFFEGLSFGEGGGGEVVAVVGEEKKRIVHRRCGSFEAESLGSGGGDGGMKKAMPAEKLAELSLVDPKRAKRILANRQAAARSKERKMRYCTDLERKVQTLQTEANSLSAQVSLLQRDTTGLTAENRELKLRLQALEQQAQLRDALHEALREEVQRLRIATGRSPPITGNGAVRGLPPQFTLSAQASENTKQTQQQQHQVHMSRPAFASSHQAANQQLRPDFSGFNHMVQ